MASQSEFPVLLGRANLHAVDDKPRLVSRSSSSSSACILGTGAAFANTYTTDEMLVAFHENRRRIGDTGYDADFADRVFRACGFDGHSVALPKENLFKPMSRSEYLEHRSIALLELAERACHEALEMWGGDPMEITHLFWGTMTGAMHSPTIDIALVDRLGLNPDVQRTSIEGMGCLTGYRVLNLGGQVAESDPAHRILVVAGDLRSALGNSLPDRCTNKDIVSVSLFRDAASAAVVGGSPLPGRERAFFDILSGGSRIVKDSRHCVDYQELDGGKIRLHLDKALPDYVAAAEPDFIKSMVANAEKRGYSVPPLSEFDVACHTGGPRVLKGIAAAVGVQDEQLAASWHVMRSHGNLSGASNLAVLHEQNERGSKGRDWVLCLSMGPGVCLEGLLLRRSHREPIISHGKA